MAKTNEYPTLTALLAELTEVLNSGDVKAATKKTTAPAAAADEDEDEDLSEMSYNDLKKLCKSRGISASGSRDELVARLSGEDEEAEEEDEDADEEDGDDTQSQVEAATEDMSLEELAEFCSDNGLSSKGKREALIARIVKAVDAGDIELEDDDDDEEEEEEEKPAKKSKGSEKPSDKKAADKPAKKTTKKSAPADDDEDDDDDEGEETPEHKKAVAAYEKDTRAQFKKGKLDRKDLVEFLCDFYDKDAKTYKKADDDEILDMYIEASSQLIDDDGELVEEGAYTVNGVPFCCGRPLTLDEDNGKYVCEHCGAEYEAEDDD
jgi:hypothetical protein